MGFALGTIPRWAFADKTGRWNVGGKIFFFRSVAKDQKKAVYQDPNGISPYPNPITLDAIGSVGPIYFNDDEPYYIVLMNPQETEIIWEFDNYIPAGGGGGTPGDTEIDYTNFVINGQFRFFDKSLLTPLPASEIEIAPYWYFHKSNTTATDTIEFLPFLIGVTDPPFSPTYYVRYGCTNVPTGEIYKDFYIKIKDVNAFQNEFITVSVEQQGTNPAQLFEFRYLQHFGTGGAPSANVEAGIAANNVSATWNKDSITFILPSIGGKVLGTNKDDYLAIIIRLPLNVTTQFDFTNFQINLGDKVLDYEYQTYDKAKIEERSINYPIFKDFRGLDTEQNAIDITKLITIKEGICTDRNNNDIFRLKQAITKDISIPWAEGDLAGGLPSSLTLTADTWYYPFLIFRPNGGIDAGIDEALDASNLLADSNVQAAGYLFYRRVGSFRTDGSSLIKDYHQTYDTWLWDNPDNLIYQTGKDTQTFTLDVPPGFRVETLLNLRVTGPNNNVYATPTFVTTLYGSPTVNPLFTYAYDFSDTTGGMKTRIITDNNQQIKQTPLGSIDTYFYRVITLGWKDWRMD